VANAGPAGLAEPDGQTAAAADAAVATVSVPATAAIVSLLRFRVMIRRSRDKVTLQSIARGRDRRLARLPSPWGARRRNDGRRGGCSWTWRGSGRSTASVAVPPSSRALTTTNHAA
jgi:hypothetical protein